LYMPDVRHFRDQNYCIKPDCRHASKLASHRRWYRSEKGAEYRDPEENKRRVREWRKKHRKYWRRTVKAPSDALQDTTASEVVETQQVAPSLNDDALQDMNFLQPAMVVGLIASLTGSALQDTIAETSRRFVLLGQDILGEGSGSNPKGDRRDGNRKTTTLSPTLAACSESIQLGRSPAGTRRTHQPLQP
jgi:hypothetical protein